LGGVNTGDVNVKNCSAAGTDLCNTNKPPGKKCYACIDDDCSRTVSCEGDEDQCVSIRVTSGVQLKLKGCMSRSLCTMDKWNPQTTEVIEHVSCCEGDLCNGAEGVKLSLLIMLVPLIFSILFI
uniref:UPAR/Ly6 domain-containing protein n=1 Tax=Pygocentrus nattereri TaxID=42514 RepID=A0A3B4EG88_PYGNA